jgi:hypothetical protein
MIPTCNTTFAIGSKGVWNREQNEAREGERERERERERDQETGR